MIELLGNRRSIRRYTDKSIDPVKIELLKEAVLRSPASRNFDSWEFIFVDDQEILKQLALCKPHGAKFLDHAVVSRQQKWHRMARFSTKFYMVAFYTCLNLALNHLRSF